MFNRRGHSADNDRPEKGDDFSESSLASSAGSVVEFDPSQTNIPSRLLQVLESWSQIANRTGTKITLKAGLAVSFYLHSSKQGSRGVSPQEFAGSTEEILEAPFRPQDWSFIRTPNDIDYTIIPTADNLRFHERAFSTYSPFANRFRSINSPPYRGQKIEFPFKVKNETVDLEGIGPVYVRCPGNAYYFDVSYDQTLQQWSKPFRFPGGRSTCFLAPVELVIFEKLLAARGPEDGKHDLSDALALLVTQSVNAGLFTHLVAKQRYLKKLDPESLHRGADLHKKRLCVKRLLDSTEKIRLFGRSSDNTVIDEAPLGSIAVGRKITALRRILSALSG